MGTTISIAGLIVAIAGLIVAFIAGILIPHLKEVKSFLEWLRSSLFKTCEQRLKERDKHWETIVLDLVKGESGMRIAQKVCERARKRH